MTLSKVRSNSKMAKKKIESIGFGFVPQESRHHFLVVIPKKKDSKVLIYERFDWNGYDENSLETLPNEAREQTIDQRFDRLKVELAPKKWSLIADALSKELKDRLKEKNYKSGGWKIGQTPVQRLLGKEMVLLTWAIEDSDPRVIPDAIKNWLGLKPEERWWLYTMTNASTGEAHTKFGWRKAIRFALTENPVNERFRQASLFDQYIEDKLENYVDKNDK